MKKEIDWERASRVRKAKKARAGHPLTYTQLACMCLYLFERQGTLSFPEGHQVRKLMYLQRYGDMEEWSSGWYNDLFYRGGAYKSAHPSVEKFYSAYQSGSRVRWALTREGRVCALSAIKLLEDRCHCRVVPVPEG